MTYMDNCTSNFLFVLWCKLETINFLVNLSVLEYCTDNTFGVASSEGTEDFCSLGVLSVGGRKSSSASTLTASSSGVSSYFC